MKLFLLSLLKKLHPSYECELCVGQDYWAGCYCAYYGAYLPNDPDGPWWWRHLLKLEAYLEK